MIELNCAQGSKEWTEARLGIPTSSQFSKILTAKGLKVSASANKYMHELLAETLTGYVMDSAVGDFMERGRDMEIQAVKFYEFTRDVTTRPIGFIYNDAKTCGCSPDRLIGEDGGLEIKCPAAHTHIGYLLDGIDDKYRLQVQGTLWITGRKWWDLLSFNPDMPPALIRCEPDRAVFDALDSAMPAFIKRLKDARVKLGITNELKQTA